MATRTPKAVVEKARALYKEGKSIKAIAFLIDAPVSEEKIRSWVDPKYAAQVKKHFIIKARRGY